MASASSGSRYPSSLVQPPIQSPVPLSGLERLPVEILRLILMECQNPAFIFTSQALHDVVDVFKPLRKLVIRWCHENSALACTKPNLAHRYLRYLMQEPWMTFGWIWESTVDTVFESCEQLLRLEARSTDATPDKADAAVNSMKDLIYSVFGEHRSSMRWRNWCTYLPYDDPLNIELVRKGDKSTTRYFEALKTQIDLSGSEIRITGPHPERTTVRTHSPCPDVHIGCLAAFPQHFLRGPWTQTQGDLFTFYLRFFSHHWNQPSKQQRADIQMGLTRVLQTQNRAALAAFFEDQMMPLLASSWNASPISYTPQKSIETQDWDTTRVFCTRDRVRRVTVNLVRRTISLTSEQREALQKWLDDLNTSNTEQGTATDQTRFRSVLASLVKVKRCRKGEDSDWYPTSKITNPVGSERRWNPTVNGQLPRGPPTRLKEQCAWGGKGIRAYHQDSQCSACA